MPFPKQFEVEVPLLQVLDAAPNGQARPSEIYGAVAEHFPNLTAEEQEERLPNYPSTRRWTNLVQWVRQRLVDSGHVDSPERGIWRITPAGRDRLKAALSHRPTRPTRPTSLAAGIGPASLRDLVNVNAQEIKSRLMEELRGLTPRAFEHFCRELFAHLGYRNVMVTKKSHDGGIDGHGDFRQGAVRIRSAFQAKRWGENPVGRPEIDKFRGAIQGDYDHGVFLTTSRFSKGAIEASFRKGAITILLLDGAAIADLLIERGLGVRKVPLFLYEVDDEFFDLTEE